MVSASRRQLTVTQRIDFLLRLLDEILESFGNWKSNSRCVFLVRSRAKSER